MSAFVRCPERSLLNLADYLRSCHTLDETPSEAPDVDRHHLSLALREPCASDCQSRSSLNAAAIRGDRSHGEVHIHCQRGSALAERVDTEVDVVEAAGSGEEEAHNRSICVGKDSTKCGFIQRWTDTNRNVGWSN